MSETLVNALISIISGLIGVIVGSFVSYRFQIRLEKLRREYENQKELRRKLQDGAKEFALTKNSKFPEFIALRQIKGLYRTVTIISYILFLVLIAIVFLTIFVSDIREYTMGILLSDNSLIIATTIAILFFSVGMLFMPTIKKD